MDNSTSNPVYETCHDILIYETLDGDHQAYQMNEIKCMEQSEEDSEPYVMSTCNAYERNQN